MEIILAAALLPAIILMIYVYKQDTVEKEPIGLLLRPAFWRKSLLVFLMLLRRRTKQPTILSCVLALSQSPKKAPSYSS